MKAEAWPRKLLTWAMAQVRKRYGQLKTRYGPRYTYVMVLAVFLAIFLPVPGSTVLAVCAIALVAEIHRAISKQQRFFVGFATLLNLAAVTCPRKLVMSNHCDVIIDWKATPEQLTALGAALWRWCARPAGNASIYGCLENQALADLIAGKHPTSGRNEQRGIHLWVRGAPTHGRQATIDRLRREIPAAGVKDIVVDGTSWNQDDSRNSLVAPHFRRVYRQETDDRRGEPVPRPLFASCVSSHNFE